MMSSTRFPRFAVVVAALLCAPTAQAAVLFSNFGAGDSFDSRSGNIVSGKTSTFGFTSQMANPFTPSFNTTLTSADLAVNHSTGTSAYTLAVVNA